MPLQPRAARHHRPQDEIAEFRRAGDEAPQIAGRDREHIGGLSRRPGGDGRLSGEYRYIADKCPGSALGEVAPPPAPLVKAADRACPYHHGSALALTLLEK